MSDNINFNLKNKFSYKKTLSFFFRYFFFLIIIGFFLFELVFCDFVLKYTLYVLPYFGLYQFFYNCINFIVFKLNKSNNLLISRIFYSYNFGQTFSDIDKAIAYITFLLK